MKATMCNSMGSNVDPPSPHHPQFVKFTFLYFLFVFVGCTGTIYLYAGVYVCIYL